MSGFVERVELRPASREEFQDIQRVDLAAGSLFDSTGLIDEGPTGQSPIPLQALEQGLQEKLLTVATRENGEIIGFVLCSPRLPDLYLDQISVDPTYGRRGVGDLLIKHVIETAKARKMRNVLLSTFRDVPWNGPYYARYGFREIPRSRMKRWMHDLERAQAKSMDVSLRCFMRRPISSPRNWFGLGSRAKKVSKNTIVADLKS